MSKIREPEVWDILPMLEKGDETPDPIFYAVGYSLSNWELLEGTLALLFKAFLETIGDGAERAYGTITGFTGRVALLREAFDSFRFKDLEGIKEFPALLGKMAKLSARRNEIAHGVVQGVSVNNEEVSFFLCPARYNSRKNMSGAESLKLMDEYFSKPEEQRPPMWQAMAATADYRYTSEQVLAYAHAFARLSVELEPVWHAVIAKVYAQPKFH